jgi:hypothetical protein
MTLTLTHHVLNTGDLTDIQATMNTHGLKATIDAITLHGRALLANKLGSTRQLVLSGRDPGNPDHFMTLRGTATFNTAGKLIKVTGTYVYQVLSDSGGIPNSDCFGSGTFATGKKLSPSGGGAQAALEAYLKASNTGQGEGFGTSVALDGDTLAVGAPNSEAVYVFTRTGGDWSQQAYVKASNTGTSDEFGTSVALAGDTLAVGAPLEASAVTGVNGNQADNSAFGSGAVYVYRAQ